MPTKKELEVREEWPQKLLMAIATQGIIDWVQGNIGIYDSSCIPYASSLQECKENVRTAKAFFEGTQYEPYLEDLNAKVPEFVRMLRKTRPLPDGTPSEFKCPNCGGTVKVRWVDKKAGIIKGRCTSGCAFDSVYHLPLKEVEAINRDG